MRTFIKNFKALFINLCVIVFLIVILIVISLIKLNVDASEAYTKTFINFYQVVIGSINNIIPFSMTELLLILFVISCIFFLVLAIINLCKKRFMTSLTRVVNLSLTIVSFITLYNLTAGVQYNRKPLELPYYEGEVIKEDFVDIVNYYLADYNNCSNLLSYNDEGGVISPYSFDKLKSIIQKDYEILKDNTYFNSFITNPKEMALLGWLYRELHITGFYFGIAGESNINTLSTDAELPFVIAHEIAHGKGVMRENDAQVVAAYITLHSSDPYVRYSGYINTFASLMNILKYTDNKSDYSNAYNKINQNILNEYKYISAYWAKFDFFSKIGEWWNNLYLYLSGNKGTGEYDDKPPVIDEETNQIINLSNYQKIYFEIYYNK